MMTVASNPSRTMTSIANQNTDCEVAARANPRGTIQQP